MMALPALRAGFLYAGIVFAIGFALGALRELFLRRHFGELPAILLEIPVMLALSWVTARWLIVWLEIPAHATGRLTMGFFAFAVLLTAEAGVGIFLMGQSAAAHIQSYLSMRGTVTLASQSVFALIPFLSLLGAKPL